jgi:Flp pilus assembly protein TadG
MRALLGRFGRDRTATITVEFTLLLPVMLAILFGSFEITRMVRASIRVTNAAQTIADLVAQQEKVTAGGMANFCKGGQIVLTPFPSASLAASVASVTNASGTRTVDWQDTSCGSAGAIATAGSLATGYTPNPADSVIVVRAVYTYTPTIATIIAGSFTMTRYAYARPRNGAPVGHS